MTARILVVDDEPDLETLIQQKFRHQIRDGVVSFLFARDGVDALTVLEANRDVDLVVTDINMPRMDGLSLLQKLQESDEKLSTIIVSAYGDGRRRPNGRMHRSRVTSRPIWLNGLPATRTRSISADNVARSQRCSPTLPASPR